MVKKNVLIISSGGREHAIGWKLKQSPKVGKIYFAPGTVGTETIGESTGIPALDFEKLVKFASSKKNAIYLTVAAPDDILAAGIVNAFQKKGLKIFGPTKEASQIEWSKAFAKDLMKSENIPTAKYSSFTKAADAKNYLKNHPFPAVIKASGLALGKGVIISPDLKHALKTIDEVMVKNIFGDAGKEVVIEEFLEGREISIHAFSDGLTFSIFPSSRDHKPIYDGNRGPNTGGMGTITPVPKITKNDLEIIKKTIVAPVLDGLRKRGSPFIGCIYPGLMMTKNGPKVIEFNSRFGDPEIESYMRTLKSDLFDILLACAEGKLAKNKIRWSKKFACTIVLASKGYPQSSHKGDVIYGLEKYKKNKDIIVFHFATKKEDGKIVTNGGRVLAITATGRNLNEALKKAYSAIGPNEIHFDGMQFRTDIGKIL
jgi:phosphoribosylamine--glycine ligase